ncbi:hypothetical protein [Streptomyces sp. NPDC002516]
MPGNTIDDLLSATQQHVVAFFKDGNTHVLLTSDVLELVERLLRAERRSDGERQFEVAVAVGSLRLARYLARQDGTGYEDIAAAVEQFAVVARYDPSGVPDELPHMYAMELLRHSEAVGDRQKRDQAITLLRQCCGQPSDPNPVLEAGYNLGVALWRRFTSDLDAEDLDESITLLWRAVALTEAGTPQRPMCLSSLSVALRTRFDHARDEEDLRRAVACSRDAVAVHVPGHPYTPLLMSNHGLVLLALYDRTAVPDDLAEAEGASRRAIAATPSGHPEMPEMLRILSVILGRRYDRDRDREVLDEAVSRAAEAERSSRGLASGARASILVEFAAVLRRRFTLAQVPADLDRAIDSEREAARAREPGHPDRPGILCRLSMSLQTRFSHLQRAEDLDEAVETAREAVAALPQLQEDRATIMHSLACALMTRYIESGRIADLDEAVSVGTEAVRAETASDTARASLRFRLGVMLMSRFDRLGNRADLEGALVAGRAALDGAGVGSPDAPLRRRFVLSALRVRAQHADDAQNLDEAITLGHAAVDDPSTDRGGHARASADLVLALIQRFDRQGDERDVHRAVEIGERALALTPGADPMWVELKNVLGISMMTKFRHSGDVRDLNSAVEQLRGAIDGCQPGRRERVSALGNLGAALTARFTHTGNEPDLVESIRLGEQAEAESLPGEWGLTATWSELARSWLMLFERRRRPGDLDRALRWAVRAADHTRDDHFQWANRQFRVLSVLQLRIYADNDPRELEAAIDRARAVKANLGRNHHSRGAIASSLGGLLLLRYEWRGDPDDVKAALELFAEAVRGESEWSADRARFQVNVGTALRLRFMAHKHSDDLVAALAVWREAVESSAATPVTRIQAADRLGDFASTHDRWDDALWGFDAAVRLLPLLAWRGTSRSTQENSVAEYLGLATKAASCAMTTGRVDRAVELLEHGRGVMWSQYLETQTDLDELARVSPTLAAELNRVRDGLAATGESAASRSEFREANRPPQEWTQT